MVFVGVLFHSLGTCFFGPTRRQDALSLTGLSTGAKNIRVVPSKEMPTSLAGQKWGVELWRICIWKNNSF